MPDEITLRPVTADDLDLFEREFSGPHGAGPYQWFGFRSQADLRRRFAETGLLGPDGGVLSVAEADRTVGRVEWFAASWGRPDTSSCWSLAIGIVPASRGLGIGTQVQRLLAEYLFDHTRTERLQAWTDHGNKAEFVPFLQFDTEIRRVVCTTNAIESVNARIRKAVRARGHFPNEATALKCIYMAVMSLDPTGAGRKRWTMRWKPAPQAFDIAFGGRLSVGRR
jgi:RimJ/RimL family protein N-acetyltransferase